VLSRKTPKNSKILDVLSDFRHFNKTILGFLFWGANCDFFAGATGCPIADRDPIFVSWISN
jgi:hypothetical protein